MFSLFIGPIGTPEIIVIALLFVLLFGADKLPEMARSFGKAQKEFEKAKIQAQNELKNQREEIKQQNQSSKDEVETDKN